MRKDGRMGRSNGASCVRNNLEEDKRYVQKKFVNLREAVELYSIGLTKLRSMASEAGAIHKIGGLVLINTVIFEEYLETFRIVGD